MWILNSSNKWEKYNPSVFKVYVILHGFNGNLELLYNLYGKNNVETIFLPEYDIYPKGWQTNNNWMNDKINTDEKNLATLVDNMIIKKFNYMIRESSGPSLVVTGSRGGQITLSRLWKFWRGPSICLNGGCQILEKITNVKLGVITCGKDFFHTNNLFYTLESFKNRTDELLIYHNTEDDHGVQSYDEAMLHLLNKIFNYNIDVNLDRTASVITL